MRGYGRDYRRPGEQPFGVDRRSGGFDYLRLLGIIAQADLAVAYAGSDPEREIAVEDTIERISEPGPNRRGGRW